MIRINLLPADREKAKKKAPVGAGNKMVFGCSAILVIALGVMGWRYWTVTRDSTALDAEISTAQQETARLHSVIQQVQQFEQRKAMLQQRVVLIEQLRKGQTEPVHMLDQISRAMPPMLWLATLKQIDDSVLIDGRSTSVTGVTDFVSNLEASGYFKKSTDIVSSQTEPMSTPPGELVRFSIRAQFQQPEAIKP